MSPSGSHALRSYFQFVKGEKSLFHLGCACPPSRLSHNQPPLDHSGLHLGHQDCLRGCFCKFSLFDCHSSSFDPTEVIEGADWWPARYWNRLRTTTLRWKSGQWWQSSPPGQLPHFSMLLLTTLTHFAI